jgi:hypothetical protein
MNDGLPLLLRLYAFPGVAALAAAAGACLVRHLWTQRLLFALAVVLITPVPISSWPGGSLLLPLGLFVIVADAFPKAIGLMALHVAVLSCAFWLLGLVTGALKNGVKRDGRHLLHRIVFGFLLAGAAAGGTVILVTYRTTFDTAFREMKYPNVEIEIPIQPFSTHTEGYEVTWRTMDTLNAVFRFYETIGIHFSDCSQAADGSIFSGGIIDIGWTCRHIQIERKHDYLLITVWVERNENKSVYAVWKTCMTILCPKNLLTPKERPG